MYVGKSFNFRTYYQPIRRKKPWLRKRSIIVIFVNIDILNKTIDKYMIKNKTCDAHNFIVGGNGLI